MRNKEFRKMKKAFKKAIDDEYKKMKKPNKNEIGYVEIAELKLNVPKGNFYKITDDGKFKLINDKE